MVVPEDNPAVDPDDLHPASRGHMPAAVEAFTHAHELDRVGQTGTFRQAIQPAGQRDFERIVRGRRARAIAVVGFPDVPERFRDAFHRPRLEHQ